jgi:two-component system, NtrC family, sensor kinase
VSLVIPTTGCAVTVSTELDGDGVVACVPEELNQVLTNLIENAIDAVPADGTGKVEVRASNEGPLLVLSVKDNGVGISADELPKIFTAFYSTKEVGRGMGMGLTIVRRVVTSLGGTIGVSSQVGMGTEITIRLPRLVRELRPREPSDMTLLGATP